LELTEEITHFKHHVISVLSSVKKTTQLELLKFIFEYSMADIFPYICIALRIYLTLACTTSIYERSYSKLKIIKTIFRPTMNQTKLTNLALLFIEKEITNSIDFDSVINDFAEVKTKRIKF